MINILYQALYEKFIKRFFMPNLTVQPALLHLPFFHDV